jgi:hypothetical protein
MDKEQKRIFLDIREDKGTNSGYFVRNDLKEMIEKLENMGEVEVVGIIYDGSYNLELITKPLKS